MKNIFTKIAVTIATGTVVSMATLVNANVAGASSLLIANAGFEDPILSENDFTVTPPPGWKLYDPSGLVSPNPGVTTNSIVGIYNPPPAAFPGEAPEGNNVSFIYLVDQPGSGIVGLTQTLKSTLTANTKYNLQVKVGDQLPFDTFDFLAGFPGYRVELLAGSTVLAFDDNTLTLTEGTFATSVVSFTTSNHLPNLGAPLGIRLINLLNDRGVEVNFDDVKLDATSVPEPTSILGLLGFGVLGAGSFLKKKLVSLKA